jgi:hypothetical protein
MQSVERLQGTKFNKNMETAKSQRILRIKSILAHKLKFILAGGRFVKNI